jgi:Mce-associated membrane protein
MTVSLDKPATSPGPDPATPPPSGRRTGFVALFVAAVLLLIAAAVLGVVVQNHRSHRDDLERAREAALASARQTIINLDALSFSTIDADLKRVLGSATGKFADQFGKAQTDLKALVAQQKTQSSGQVVSSAVVKSDTDTALVLIAVDRTVKDTTNPAGAVAHDRWAVSLEKHGGRWLVADLQPVG